MSDLTRSSKRLCKSYSYQGAGDTLTSNVWLLISVSLFLPLHVRMVIPNGEVTDVRALLLLSKQAAMSLISRLIYKMRVPASLPFPVETWQSEAFLWDIIGAVSSDFFVLTGSFAVYCCMKSLALEPTWHPSKITLISTSCFVNVPVDGRHLKHQVANALQRFLENVFDTLERIRENSNWQGEIKGVFLTVPTTGVTYKIKNHELGDFAVWLEKEERNFLNKSNDNYNLYQEERDRQPPEPFNVWDAYDWFSIVKVLVQLPREVRRTGIRGISFQFRPTMYIPRCMRNPPKAIVKLLNNESYQLVSYRSGARNVLKYTNLDICQLYCKLKRLDDNTRKLAFTMSSESRKAIISGTMSVRLANSCWKNYYVPDRRLRVRIKKFQARGFMLLDDLDLSSDSSDADESTE